jgi:hypothetical protein
MDGLGRCCNGGVMAKVHVHQHLGAFRLFHFLSAFLPCFAPCYGQMRSNTVACSGWDEVERENVPCALVVHNICSLNI